MATQTTFNVLPVINWPPFFVSSKTNIVNFLKTFFFNCVVRAQCPIRVHIAFIMHRMQYFISRIYILFVLLSEWSSKLNLTVPIDSVCVRASVFVFALMFAFVKNYSLFMKHSFILQLSSVGWFYCTEVLK